MKETRLMWDMPITVNIIEAGADKNSVKSVFEYFNHIDSVFNTFIENSEISKINRGEIKETQWSNEMKEVIALCEKTHQETHGYFNHKKAGLIDPLGIVKGWALERASETLRKKRFTNFYIDAGGDIQAEGVNAANEPWKVGIRNPFNRFENVKILALSNCGVATSGTYIRGNHIYNPYNLQSAIPDVVSLTVIGTNVYEADRFATAAFAMGKDGIYFVEKTNGIEGYVIDKRGKATYTSGFEQYVVTPKHIINSFSQTHL